MLRNITTHLYTKYEDNNEFGVLIKIAKISELEDGTYRIAYSVRQEGLNKPEKNLSGGTFDKNESHLVRRMVERLEFQGYSLISIFQVENGEIYYQEVDPKQSDSNNKSKIPDEATEQKLPIVQDIVDRLNTFKDMIHKADDDGKMLDNDLNRINVIRNRYIVTGIFDEDQINTCNHLYKKYKRYVAYI